MSGSEPQRIAPADRLCAYCQQPFTARRAWSAFCSDKCRAGYDADFGTLGHVAGVRRLGRGGVSVTIHFDGPAADRALNLLPVEVVRVVKQP